MLLLLVLGAASVAQAADVDGITPVPAPTEADRIAARPPAMAHGFHDNAVHGFVLADQLEYWNADPGAGAAWAVHGWLGTDLDRLWLRSEGMRADGRFDDADAELLYGHAVSRWWDVVAGVRQQLGSGGHTWAAIGVQGLAPWRIEVDATAYATANGRTALRMDARYSLLLTNRLVLQPRVELRAHGRDDDAQDIAGGFSSLTAGLRLRYEFTRRFAPYAGLELDRALGDTATTRRSAGQGASDMRMVLGLRTWF
jgi:copper resistance protein B